MNPGATYTSGIAVNDNKRRSFDMHHALSHIDSLGQDKPLESRLTLQGGTRSCKISGNVSLVRQSRSIEKCPEEMLKTERSYCFSTELTRRIKTSRDVGCR
jgi:hypothetical protein